MIAAPLPLLWRRRDVVAALGRIDAKAIITAGRIDGATPAAMATEVAAELFPIRYIGAFGQDLPDGVVTIDDCFAPSATDTLPHVARSGPAAAHVAVVTFEIAGDGLVAVARNHAQILAGGEALVEVTGRDILSTIPPASFAGIVLTLMPWLKSGGALHLHHGFDPAAFAAQSAGVPGAAIVLPGPALAPLAEAKLLGHAEHIVALWRAPERLANAPRWRGEAAVIDMASFGEIGIVGGLRPPDGYPVLRNPHPAIVEAARTGTGTLALRGPVVAVDVFPPGAEMDHQPFLAPDAAGFVDTGFACRRDGETWTITAPPRGIAGIGGYRLIEREAAALVAEVDPAATLLSLPHAATGQRLAGSAADPVGLAGELRARGINALICEAFRPRETGRAA